MARWARFRWPEEFKCDPRELGVRGDLVVRTEDDHLRLTTREQYDGTRSELITLDAVVSGDQPLSDTDVAVVSAWDPLPQIEGDNSTPRVERELRRLLHLDDEETPDLEEFAAATQLYFTTIPDNDFLEWIRSDVPAVWSTSLPDYRMALLTFSNVVHVRMAWARVLFAAKDAQEWLPSHGELGGLEAMSGLFGHGFRGSPTFLHPLLGAEMPWAFGTSASRPPNGIAVFLFGAVVPGRIPMLHDDIGEGLTSSLLTSGVVTRAPKTPSIGGDEALEALRWWVSGINRLMSVALDPTLFVDSDGWYQPAEHQGYLASIDRFFESVIASLVQTGRDEYSRRLHLFETLDLLEGFSLGGYDKTLSLPHLLTQYEQLEADLPAEAAWILLPRCRAAVDAMEQVQHGFHTDRISDDQLITVDRNGDEIRISLANAASRLVRAVRNSGHAMRNELGKPATLALFSGHNGELDADLSDLGFFHLVRLVADASLLETPLMRRLGPQAGHPTGTTTRTVPPGSSNTRTTGHPTT